MDKLGIRQKFIILLIFLGKKPYCLDEYKQKIEKRFVVKELMWFWYKGHYFYTGKDGNDGNICLKDYGKTWSFNKKDLIKLIQPKTEDSELVKEMKNNFGRAFDNTFMNEVNNGK